MSEYVSIPDGYDFNTKFSTWIIAYCPDTLSWFVTNKRFFYYEYPEEFDTEQGGIDFIKSNPNIFYKLENEMMKHRPQFAEGHIYLDNTEEKLNVDVN